MTFFGSWLAASAALNVWGILRETWEDFRNSDRFFKYKAGVISTWVLLSVVSAFASCPPSNGPHNTLGAELVQTSVAGSPVVRIINKSGRDWTDVLVVVNGSYRASVGKIPAKIPDNDLILEPRKLLGESGKFAPADLVFRDLAVRARQGEADLLVNGVAPP